MISLAANRLFSEASGILICRVHNGEDSQNTGNEQTSLDMSTATPQNKLLSGTQNTGRMPVRLPGTASSPPSKIL